MEKQPTIWNQDFNLKTEIFNIQSYYLGKSL